MGRSPALAAQPANSRPPEVGAAPRGERSLQVCARCMERVFYAHTPHGQASGQRTPLTPADALGAGPRSRFEIESDGDI